ncbi:MAG: hypothetical protein OSA98_13655 [Rubripirellula sp.]|nr:hypothetical protein [Rubripirellula sp.]
MPKPGPYGDLLRMRLRTAFFVLHYCSNRHIVESDISADQCGLLACFADEDGITQNDLSIRFSSDERTLIDPQERKGLIEHPADSSDCRAWHIFLIVVGQIRHVQLSRNLGNVWEMVSGCLIAVQLAVIETAFYRNSGAFANVTQSMRVQPVQDEKTLL